MPSRATILPTEEALRRFDTARIVALRWDLVPWALVLDCDFPDEPERGPQPLRRAWMVFQGISEISCSIEGARLPIGILGRNVAYVSESYKDGFRRYELPISALVFSKEETVVSNPQAHLDIMAQDMVCVVSSARTDPGPYGLDLQQRNSLATEAEFLHALTGTSAQDLASRADDLSGEIENVPAFPRGGITLRKYAAMTLALARARGALFSALDGDLEGAKEIFDETATLKLARALGCSEVELAIDWNDHLSPAEIKLIDGL